MRGPDTSGARSAFLGCAADALDLLGRPELGAAWTGPSTLAELSVAGLAGHLADQVLTTGRLLAEPAGGSGDSAAPITLAEHYARAAWVGAELDAPVNRGVREAGERLAEHGPLALRRDAAEALDRLRVELPAAGDRVILIPWTGWALRLDDFLASRTLELAVHTDDLALSIGLEPPAMAEPVQDLVLTLLAGLAVRRHGAAAVLRALSRAERAPASIAAI